MATAHRRSNYERRCQYWVEPNNVRGPSLRHALPLSVIVTNTDTYGYLLRVRAYVC